MYYVHVDKCRELSNVYKRNKYGHQRMLQWNYVTSMRLDSPVTWLFVQQFDQTYSYENIHVLHYWLFVYP